MADPSRRRAFPSRGVVRSASGHCLGDVERVLARAPWWDTKSIRDRALIAHYENADGLLPDGLPSCIFDSWYFHRRCLVPEGDLLPLRGGRSARLNHIKDVYARFARMPCAEPIPASYGLDLYCYRTSEEVEHVEMLCGIDPARWIGVRDVSQDVLCLPRPILRADFRYAAKSESPCWKWVKWERRMRRNDGLLVSYHCK